MLGQLATLLRSRVSLIWLALIIATLISWNVASDHGLDARLSTTIVILVAFIKVRFVGLDFMELRNAPLPLRFTFEGYCLVVGVTLITMYLTAGNN